MTQDVADIEPPSEWANDSGELAPSPDYSTDLRQLRVDALGRPGDAEAWRALGRALRSKGERSGAVAAFARSVAVSLADAEFATIEGLIRTGHVLEARRSLADRMKSHADDIVALRLAADLAAGTGNLVEAERLYRRCIDLCPSYLAARHGLSRLLLLQARLGEASNETERMLAAAPTDPGVRTLKAAVAASVGNHEDAVTLYRGLIGELPEQAAPWLALGHSERTIGRYQEAVAAYRHALEIPSGAAEAYWSLSNLKTYRFDDADIDRMHGLVTAATGQQATHLHFALGAAYDERGHSDRAFEAFARGNAEKRTSIDYDPTVAAQRLRHWTGSITDDLLASRDGAGDPSPAPIFVVGLPRSGSTLVEQILGSHSLIENTAELPYMNRIVSRLARRGLEPGRERANLNVDGVDLGALGRSYISAAQAHRKTAKPFFVDKLPGNFAHVGLLRLMLPNARIIDVRRHPIATTWSVFKQLFAHGQPFAYDLSEIAQWYRGYVAAMAGFDDVMPGSVFRVHYERLVDDTEGEIHRLLGHVGVAFEPDCLRFHASGNPVRTPSSEQVRRPIFRSGLDDWQRYRSHLSMVEADLASEVAKYLALPTT